MNPVAILIEEHNTILKMIAILKAYGEDPSRIVRTPGFLDKAIDFFKTYADRCHHGKEENILFRRLQGKNLSDEDRRLLLELMEEHRIARGMVEELSRAARESSLLAKQFKALAGLYEQHIDKENNQFFMPAFKYFSAKEREEILREFLDADRKMIHEKYLQLVDEFEKLAG